MEVLTHPMLDQLAQLGLSGMAQAFAELEASGEGAILTHADWLGLLVDREVTHRRDKRLATRLRYARLRHHAVVEDVDYRAPRGLDRALFHKLAGGEWIDAHDNLILCGPTGVGKSWLACALGHKACRDNRSVLYQRVPKLFADLALARGDGRYARIMRSLNGAQLSFSTIGASTPSTPAPAATSTRSSKNATAAARPSLPARSPSINGMRSSVTRPTPTPSSTGSSTTPIASISPATACAGPDRDQPQRIDQQLTSRQNNPPAGRPKRATSCRNSERHDLGMTGRHRRNQQPFP